MKSSIRLSQNSAGGSLFSGVGATGAAAPTSALKLLRIDLKRRRSKGSPCDTSNEGQIDANSKGLDDGKTEKYKLVLPPSPSPQSLLCLLKNRFFSLPLGITELAGPAGVGKTQIALSLCADCVQPYEQQCHNQERDNYRNKKKAVFIQLGGSSRFLQTVSRRLKQMLESRITANTVALNSAAKNTQYRQGHSQHQYSDDEIIHECLTRILVNWVCNSEELMELLRKSLPRLLRMHPDISIVVLDGIANLFRILPSQQQYQKIFKGDENDDRTSSKSPLHDRAVKFFQISNLCKELSSRFEVPFVVLNECTSRIPNAVEHRKAVLEPALGLAWSQCVNCRFFVRRGSQRSSNTTRVPWQHDKSRDHDSRENNSYISKRQQDCSHRVLKCLKAPHVSSDNSISKFLIDRSGVIPI